MTNSDIGNKVLEGMTRPEKRRLWKQMNKRDDYENTRFWDLSSYKGVILKASKYMPHIGKKQREKANG